MDERTFLNNNIVYTFMTHFLLKVCSTLETQCIISNQLSLCFHYAGLLEIFLNLLFQVQSQVFSEANCANLISTLITNLISQYQNLQSDFSNRVEISKASASLNGVRTMQRRRRHTLLNCPSVNYVAFVFCSHNFNLLIRTLSHVRQKTNFNYAFTMPCMYTAHSITLEATSWYH